MGVWSADEPLHVGASILLWGGDAQLQPQLHSLGGNLRGGLRGIPRDRAPLGPMAPPLPRGTILPPFGREEGLPCSEG